MPAKPTEPILQVSPAATASSMVTVAEVNQPAEQADLDDRCNDNDVASVEHVHQLADSGDDKDEEGIVQIVTPLGKTTQALLPDHEEMQLSVQQYQTVIADYKEYLVQAERQVHAMSKTQLADKFMENKVCEYVKESLWKQCKFITCQEMMDDCMDKVASHFVIDQMK